MTSRKKRPEDLRSHRWLGVNDLRSFGHRSRLRQIGYDTDDWAGKPVIGIINTWSDINACHAHLRARAEDVKRGVLAGRRLPDRTAGDVALRAVREADHHALSQFPGDGDRGAAAQPSDRRRGADGRLRQDHARPDHGRDRMGIPAIYVPAGPMLRGNWRGEMLGSGSDVWKYWDEKRAGNITDDDWNEIEGGIARSFGTCMVMGTAATMMAIAEALGLTLPGASSIPAADASHPRMCAAAGRRIVDMVWEDLTPASILTPAAFDNAIKVHMAIGGSTNAIIHVVAMARRAGIALDMERFDADFARGAGDRQCRPSGKYLMEDFYLCRRLARADARDLRDLLDLVVPDGHRQDARREHRGRAGPPARRDPSAERSDLCGTARPRC